MRSGWIVGLPCLIIANIAQGQNHQDTGECYECLPNQPITTPQLRVSLPITLFPTTPYEPFTEQDAHKPENNGQKSPESSPREGIWTLMLTWFTRLVSDPVAVVTTILALLTGRYVVHAGRQTVATVASVRAAQESIKLARDSLIIENRAYLTPVEFLIGKAMDVNSHRIYEWRFTPTWKNTGKTPAKKVRQLTNAGFFPKEGLPPNFDFPDMRLLHPNQLFAKVIGADFITMAPHCEITAFLVRDALKTHRFFLWCWIEYQDIFPETPIRRSEYCGELVAIGDLADPRISPEKAFRWDSVDKFNGMDEDCHRKPGQQAPLATEEELFPNDIEPVLWSATTFAMPYPRWDFLWGGYQP